MPLSSKSDRSIFTKISILLLMYGVGFLVSARRGLLLLLLFFIEVATKHDFKFLCEIFNKTY